MTAAPERLLRLVMGILVISMLAVAGGRMAGNPVLREPGPSRTPDGLRPAAGMSMQVPQAMKDAMSQGRTPPPLGDVLPGKGTDAMPAMPEATTDAPDATETPKAPAATPQTEESATGPGDTSGGKDDGASHPVVPSGMPPAAGTFSEKELEDMLAMPDIPQEMRTMIERKLRGLRRQGKD